MMLALRSILFNGLWYVNIMLQMLLQAPFYFFLSHKAALGVPRRWATSTHVLHKAITGTDQEIDGLENVPEEGCIIAAKHESWWDFYALYRVLRDPAFILKAELMKIPFFGWYVGYLDMIPVRRGDKGNAMRAMISDAKKAIARNRQILIFPEGTRTLPGADPAYRYGVTRMYRELDCPVVPVALNSGLYWPRKSFKRYPGKIRARFLEPIPAGLEEAEFSKLLQERIEAGCEQLYREAMADEVSPPIPPALQKKLAE